MDLIGSLFNNAISKRVSEQLASKQSNAFANALSYINNNINSSLPTVNPDALDYYQIFKTIGAVYEVTDAIVKKFLNCPRVYYRVKDKSKLQKAKTLFKTDPVQSYILKMQAVEEMDIPQLEQMLSSGMVNPYQTGTQFLWCVALVYLLNGNSYINKNQVSTGKVKEMFSFPNMTIAANLEDLLDPIREYILLGSQYQVTSEIGRYPKEEIYHIKTGTPAPVDRRMEYLYGVSPVRAYFESTRSIKEGKQQASKQARNGGAFGVLSPKNKEDQFSADQKTALKEKMVEARKSNDELARLFPSSIGLDFTQIGLSIADLQLLELVSASEEDIYRAYHWPLQFHNQKASTSNNQATAVKQGIYDAVAPLCDVMSEAFTIILAQGYGFDYLEFDYTQLPEMAVNMKDVAAYLAALPKGVLTPNEMRVVLKYGESKEAYMNEHYIESNITTMRRVFEGNNTPSEPANSANPAQAAQGA